jgi:hypothetical protein
MFCTERKLRFRLRFSAPSSGGKALVRLQAPGHGPERKRVLEGRIANLRVAFKQAREAANWIDAQPVHEADVLFRYILG